MFVHYCLFVGKSVIVLCYSLEKMYEHLVFSFEKMYFCILINK